jgi:phosphate transport system permease protein
MIDGQSTAAAATAQRRAYAGEVSGNLASRHRRQRIAFALVWAAGFFGVFALAVVVGYVVSQGIRVVDLEFLATPIVATIYLALLTIAVASPLGVLAAIYLVEYAEQAQAGGGLVRRLVAVARFGVETLAGVPSIIFGLFGYSLLVTAMKLGFSLAAAALSGACLILPVIIRTTEEALLAVPNSYREASLALGATQWQTVWGVVLPAALPGIVTGVVLSIGRVVSETAVFFVTFGGSSNMVTSLRSPGRTMALHVYYLAMETRAFEKAMGTGAILVVTTIIINLLVNFLSRRVMRSLRGQA